MEIPIKPNYPLHLEDSKKRRDWVKPLEEEPNRLAIETSRRLDVIYQKLWSPAPRDLFDNLITPLLLGRINYTDFNNLFAQEVTHLKDISISAKTGFTFIYLLLGLTYFYRIGGRSPKVVFFGPPDRLYSGFVHILDFTPDELSTILDESIHLHGLNKLRALTDKLADAFTKDLPQLPDISDWGKKVSTDNPYFVATSQAKSNMKIGLLLVTDKLSINPNERKEIMKSWPEICNIFISPQAFEWFINLITERLKPIFVNSDSMIEEMMEQIISLAHANPQEAAKQATALKLAELAGDKNRKDAPLLRKKLQEINREIEADRGPAHNRITSPEAVLSSYLSALKLSGIVKKEFGHFRNEIVAFEEFHKKYPSYKQNWFLFAFSLKSLQRLHMARAICLHEQGITEFSFEQMIKEARNTARINQVWKALFDLPEKPFSVPPHIVLTPDTKHILDVQNALKRIPPPQA